MTAFVNFKARSTEHIGRIFKAKMSQKVSVEMLCRRIFHTAFKTNDFTLLSGHIYYYICGKSVSCIFKPLKDVAVVKCGNTDRGTLIVYLRGIIRNDKLRNHIGKVAECSDSKIVSRGCVKRGNCRKIDFSDILRKVALLNRQKVRIRICPEKLCAHNKADKAYNSQDRHNNSRYG